MVSGSGWVAGLVHTLATLELLGGGLLTLMAWGGEGWSLFGDAPPKETFWQSSPNMAIRGSIITCLVPRVLVTWLENRQVGGHCLRSGTLTQGAVISLHTQGQEPQARLVPRVQVQLSSELCADWRPPLCSEPMWAPGWS